MGMEDQEKFRMRKEEFGSNLGIQCRHKSLPRYLDSLTSWNSSTVDSLVQYTHV